ncbi:Lipoprotein [hydrothermal vent metagenome]|uniref:Lipoprotein n=1 Tax=hydrothermal vent metagenome TaxID=652676 RepID=A0A3B0WMZ1_9ZZZZ
MTTNPYAKKTSKKFSEEVVVTKEDEQRIKNKKPLRKMTFKRKLTYLLLKPIILFMVNFIWLSCRVKIIGQENMDVVIKKQKPVIPCYWHQQHLFCGWYMLKQIKRGMKVGFLVSPSVDGEIPAKIVSSRGAKVIRGSSTRTGAQALRDMYQIIAKEGVSPVTTSDGPTGPIFKFKSGAAMLSQMTKVPMLPIAYAAKNAWQLGSWDRFMIPKPFTKIVVAVGKPVFIDKAEKNLSPVQLQMENAINALMEKARENL